MSRCCEDCRATLLAERREWAREREAFLRAVRELRAMLRLAREARHKTER